MTDLIARIGLWLVIGGSVSCVVGIVTVFIAVVSGR